MKKAVIVMLVVLFSGSAFASSACKSKSNASLTSNTKGSSGSVKGSSTSAGS